VDALRRAARLFRGAAHPFESWLALRGITTLHLRMERACANALELAARLERHSRVRRVHYPGLPSHPQFERAKTHLALAYRGIAMAGGDEVAGKIRLIGQRVDPVTRLVDVIVSLPPDAKLMGAGG